MAILGPVANKISPYNQIVLFPFIKSLHLISGTTILGIFIAEYFYVMRSIVLREYDLMMYTIKTSYVGDGLILLCLSLQFFTIAPLISAGNLNFHIPWIRVAHLAFGLVILLWIFKILIKIKYFKIDSLPIFAKRIYHCLSISIFIIFFIIIHDAVMRSTWFTFLFRN